MVIKIDIFCNRLLRWRIILAFWVLWPQQLSIKVWFSFKENINGSPTTPSKSSLGNWHCTQKLALHCRQIKDVPPVMSLFLEWQMGVLPGPEAVGVCKLWGIRWPFTSPARNDAESPTYPCYKMLQDVTYRWRFICPSIKSEKSVKGMGIEDFAK